MQPKHSVIRKGDTVKITQTNHLLSGQEAFVTDANWSPTLPIVAQNRNGHDAFRREDVELVHRCEPDQQQPPENNMAAVNEFKILDGGIPASPCDPVVIHVAAVRAIVCLQELRRAMRDDSLERIEMAEAVADHIIKSAGLSL